MIAPPGGPLPAPVAAGVQTDLTEKPDPEIDLARVERSGSATSTVAALGLGLLALVLIALVIIRARRRA
ncbi:MAG: hypothetical protein H6710_22815 [Myxococcales bacterium]|nr:hypothetical protein [Myxococcales bacterium]MCB9703303.1 hypothetical protein [Myxococcales bacterium]